MLTQTHKSALQNATYSGLAALLFSGSQTVRSQRQIRQRMEALEAELAAVKAEATRANARLDIKDAGKDWKEQARAIRAAEPAIANRELARRVGVSESTVRKYMTSL
jgi:DNA-binding NarL/FixJ family response regulator